MVISGMWHQCDDGVVRPVIHAEVRTNDGSWIKAPFLLDTGADRTVFSADILAALGLSFIRSAEHIGGIGGLVESVVVETQIRLTRENAGKVVFRGQYAGVTEVDALDMSVFGRDLTNLFVVIVDWPQQVVSLLGQRHRYAITQQ
jgi:predicted aspartyl protease